jgi:hypothetical protein
MLGNCLQTGLARPDVGLRKSERLRGINLLDRRDGVGVGIGF